MGVLSKVLDLWKHPDEFWPMVQMYFAVKKARQLPKDPGLHFCYEVLNNVSRSFAVVIQQLPVELRDAICVFYLVLRALDTVEDDMAIPIKTKVPELIAFHDKIYDRAYTFDCGDGEYKRLMKNLGLVIDVFLNLKPKYQEVIKDITKRMGAGMAKFIEIDVETIPQYDEYCHYVAGLVGEGLSNLFAATGLESEVFAQMEEASNHMGLFLQKTNIIRDYLEDIMEEPAPRMFWPKEIWGKHAKSLDEFKEPENREAALSCLNDMIADALRHGPPALEYMKLLQNADVFRFCAIPQIMAINTLSLCFNNGKVFEGVVKMRRGETCKVFADCTSMSYVLRTFQDRASELSAVASGIATRDPGAEAALRAADNLVDVCDKSLKELHQLTEKSLEAARLKEMENVQPMEWWVRLGWVAMSIAYATYAFNIQNVRADLGVNVNAGSPMIDVGQKLMAIVFLIFSLWISIRGKRV